MVPEVKQTQPRWDGVEKGDLGDGMHMIAEQHRNQLNNQVETQKRKFDDFSAQQCTVGVFGFKPRIITKNLKSCIESVFSSDI